MIENNFFTDTLNLILVPPQSSDEFFSESVLRNMEDLEGDSVSFLHVDYYKTVINTNPEIDRDIALIRKSIEEIDKEFWNVEDFLFHTKWIKIRDLTIRLFIKLEKLEKLEKLG